MCPFFFVPSLILPHTFTLQVVEQVRSLLDGCVKRWPNHAGLLHYTTHAYDYPTAASDPRGLDAGLKLSEVSD